MYDVSHSGIIISASSIYLSISFSAISLKDIADRGSPQPPLVSDGKVNPEAITDTDAGVPNKRGYQGLCLRRTANQRYIAYPCWRTGSNFSFLLSFFLSFFFLSYFLFIALSLLHFLLFCLTFPFFHSLFHSLSLSLSVAFSIALSFTTLYLQISLYLRLCSFSANDDIFKSVGHCRLTKCFPTFYSFSLSLSLFVIFF
ncbi:unnamed protein product [Acanthosepion pharaonis]|uniref:Uncharacterized protein n=1 Tax=Acanthosepion pharaonis TaxID=158019 RepID=A0A812DWK6_ACAPH|nr:unnamed protein product [Sepia pharaonis]